MLPGCCRVCLHTDCVVLRRHGARHLDRGAQCFPGAAGCVCASTESSCAGIAPATWTEERNASRMLQGVSAHRLTHWVARCADQKSTPGGKPCDPWSD